MVHGGVLYTLADTGMGAFMETLPAGHYCATIEIKIAHFRPAKEGTVRCVTELVPWAPTASSKAAWSCAKPRPSLRNPMILSHDG